MRRIFSILLLLMMGHSVSAQKLPGFGKIDKEDLEMKDCEFDKGADALILLDWCEMHYDRGTAGITLFKTVYVHRTRIKILKEKGMSYADVEIPFVSRNNNERILKVDAYTYNLDEAGKVKSTSVGKSSIYTKKIDRNLSRLIIAFPEVKVGSVIEYRFEMERETWTNIKDWYFQDRIPTLYSEYQIKVPLVLRFTEQKSTIGEPESKESVVEDMITSGNDTYTIKFLKKNYVLRKLVGIREEPFMACPKDYLQRIELDLSQLDYGDGDVKDIRTKWSDVVERDLNKDEDFGLQLEKEVTGAAGFLAQAKQINDPLERMRFVFDHVRKNMIQDGDEQIYSYAGINKTYETKKGSNADINLLLIALLRQSGIKVTPILFSTRDNGLVNTYYPSLQQFNALMAHVVLGSRYYVLDAADKTQNYKIIPEDVVNTKGFLVEGVNGRWIEVIESKVKFKIMAAIHGEIDAAGVMKGDGVINASGYARKPRVTAWTSDRTKFKSTYFSSGNLPLTIDDLVVNNVEADSLPLEQKVKFTLPLSNSGDYRYFNVNLFTGIEKNPFIADDRQTDVDYGYQQEYLVFGNFLLPEGFKADELPENISLVMPDNSIVFNRFIKAEDNVLNIRITLEFKSSFYTAANYPEFKEYYKKLMTALNQQIVIKKK